MRTRNIGWAAGVLCLGLLAGCDSADKAEVRQQVQGMKQQIGQASDNAQAAAARAALESKVKAAIETRKGLDGSKINVEVKGADVHLRGDVQSSEQARLAEQTARETEGVQNVVNELTMRIPATSGVTSEPATGTGR